MKILLKTFLPLFVCLLFSCSEQSILIRENGTASVQLTFNSTGETTAQQDSLIANNGLENDTLISKDLFTEFYNNKLIKDLKINDEDTSRIQINFSIEEVDSLGKFLDPLFGLEAKTTLTNQYFELIGPSGNMNIEDDVCGCTNALTFKLKITFEKTIEKIETQNDYVKKLDNNTISIETSIGEMNFNGIGNKLKVHLK